jgi:AmmeMemoRadiSam system protein B
MEKLPKMREDVELIPMSHAGQQMVLVRDPLGLIKEPVVLNEAAALMLSMLDGTHTMSDLKLFLARRQGGVLVTSLELTQLLDRLSAFYLLQDERYEEARSAIVADYAAKPVRSAHHAGVAYPAGAEELKLTLENILASGTESDETTIEHSVPDISHTAAGTPRGDYAPSPTAREKERFGEAVAPDDVAALVAPHMDLRPAARCYAAAYNAIKGANVELVVVLGTGHSVKSNTFSLTTKDFETPLGVVTTDKGIVKKLASSPRPCVLDNDLPHRHEHSIEFQALFLQYVLGNPNFEIVPILCGSFRNSLDSANRPADIPCVGEFLSELRAIIEGERRRCLVVAGVDFSHVGIKFGDSYSGRTVVPDATEHDMALVDRLCAWDVTGFWQESRRVKDTYKVCGFAPMASMLELLPRAKGHFLCYDVAYEDATHSAVSYASVSFTAV